MNTIIPWLEHLNVLMPPRNIALVGAGNGKGIWAQWLAHQASKSRVTFIEAEPLQYSTLQRTLDLLGERAQHCEIRNTVVAAQQGSASFFVANSQQESGLLEPRSLLSLWPNLQTEEVKELSAITLDALLGELSEDAEQPMGEGHWLVIDCLPAGALLRASSKLDLVDVVIARVLLGEMHAMPDGTSLEEVAEFLQQKGMVQIAVEATRHPGIGYALFVRDARAALHVHHSECQKLRLNGEEQAKLLQEFQAQVGQLTQTKAAAEKRSQELALQLEQLGQALEKQSRLAQERLSQTEQLTQAKLIVETQSQERVQQLEQLGKARDEQAKLAQERHAQIEQLTQAKAAAEKQSQERAQQLEQLTKARDEQAKLAQERHAQIEQLTQAKAAAEKQSQERVQQLEQLTKARDEQAKLAQERHAQIEQLTQAKAAAEKQSQDRAQQLEQLTKARDEQAKLAQERLVQTEQLTQAKAAAEKQSQERAQQLEQLTKARDEQVKLAQERHAQTEQLTQAKAAAEKQSQERAQQLEQLTKARDEQAKLAQERQVQIEQLKLVSTALQKNEVQEKQFKEFQQQLESSLGERIGKVLAGQIDAGVKAQTEAFSKLLQSNLSETREGLQGVVNASETKVKNELGKGLANSVKQLESFMNIQSFFSSGDFFSDFHGWPISPDIGVFLLEKMRSQNYDLIIEFGSGTSTALFAKAAEVMSGKTQKSAVPKTLKTEIVTFEHNQLYHEKTQKMLRARKLDGYVNLIHAPLIDWKDERQDYLYYDCQSVLEDLAEKYKSQKIKILVLVDGPPGSTCKNARYPAVPIIFNAFAKQSIDIVLDDASRPEEKATIDLWREFYKKRSIAIEESSIPSEKGIHISSQIT